MIQLSFRASLVSIYAETAELSACQNADGQTDRRTDRQTDGQTDRQTAFQLFIVDKSIIGLGNITIIS